MKNASIKIFAVIFFSINFCASCTSLTKVFPKANKPFQTQTFKSDQWKDGDFQTRGEMARDLVVYDSRLTPPSKVEGKSRDEVLQMLGKPDVITKAMCCHARYPSEVELWLYFIEIEEKNQTGEKSGEKLEKQAIEIYYGGNNGGVWTLKIGDRDGPHTYFPIVG